MKDLSEKDFSDLIAAKNQDKRFYEWLHFPHYIEHKTNPFEDLEYFKQLYDNTVFTTDDIKMDDETEEAKKLEKTNARERQFSLDI